jgi:glycosyltransferase involved in cell wall biosynthesis
VTAVSDISRGHGLPGDLKVALVHDWLTGMRGGEKCLQVMAQIFPQAEIFTLLHVPGSLSPDLESRTIHTSFIQKMPSAERFYRWALPAFPRAIEDFDFSGFDLVLSSSHCVAKGAVKAPGALSVCYCYTPMRYVWDRFDDYFGDKRFPLKQLIGAQAARLRSWDRSTAGRVDHYLPISTIVRRRIMEFYGLPEERTTIVFPPVDVDRFRDAGELPPPGGLDSRSYDLVVSALVPYKKVDLAVIAAIKSGRTLVVVGKGPEKERLLALSRQTTGRGRVIFPGAVSDEELPAYYGHCRSFVFPGLEDFGITPLEATAAGRPVVAYAVGGVEDTVQDGLNGVLFTEQTVDGLVTALGDPRLDGPWDRRGMLDHVHGFRLERYRQEMAETLGRLWQQHIASGQNVGQSSSGAGN